jgi:hypothetical protein
MRSKLPPAADIALDSALCLSCYRPLCLISTARFGCYVGSWRGKENKSSANLGLVLPAGPPVEVPAGQLLKRRAEQHVVKPPSGGDMPDDQHALA